MEQRKKGVVKKEKGGEKMKNRKGKRRGRVTKEEEEEREEEEEEEERGGMEGLDGVENLSLLTGLPVSVLDSVAKRGGGGGEGGRGGGRARGGGGGLPWLKLNLKANGTWPPRDEEGGWEEEGGRRVPKLLTKEELKGWRCEVVLGEVKSENDRLDPRQEAWLHILTAGGVEARVMQVRTPGGRRKGGKKGGAGL